MRRVSRNAWDEDTHNDDLSTTPSPIASTNHVKHRIRQALNREQATQQLQDCLIPILLLRALMKRRIVETISNGFPPPSAADTPGASSVDRPTSHTGNRCKYTINSVISSIRRSDGICSSWSLDVLMALVRNCSVKHYEPGEVLMYGREPHYSCGLMVLLTGQASERKCRSRRVVVSPSGKPSPSELSLAEAKQKGRSRRAPHVFGEEAVLGEGVSPVIVTAETPADVLHISSKQLWTTALTKLTLPGVDPLLYDEFKAAVEPIRREMLIQHFYPTCSLVRRSWLFRSLSAEDASDITRLMEPRVYFPGDLVTQLGGNDPNIYFVARGTVQAKQYATKIGNFGPGSTFGEVSVVFGDTRRSTVAAKTVCDLWVMTTKQLFVGVMLTSTSMRSAITSSATQRRTAWLADVKEEQTAQAMRILQDVPMFCHCTDSILHELVTSARVRVFPRGSKLVTAGTLCDAMFIVQHGRAVPRAVLADGQSELIDGTFFGEYCLMPHRWTTDIIADTVVDVWWFSVESIRAILRRCGVEQQAVDQCVQGIDLIRRRFGAELVDVEQPTPPSGPVPPSGPRRRGTLNARSIDIQRDDERNELWEAMQLKVKEEKNYDPTHPAQVQSRKLLSSEKQILRQITQCEDVIQEIQLHPLRSSKPSPLDPDFSLVAHHQATQVPPTKHEMAIKDADRILLSLPTEQLALMLTVISKQGLGTIIAGEPQTGDSIRVASIRERSPPPQPKLNEASSASKDAERIVAAVVQPIEVLSHCESTTLQRDEEAGKNESESSMTSEGNTVAASTPHVPGTPPTAQRSSRSQERPHTAGSAGASSGAREPGGVAAHRPLTTGSITSSGATTPQRQLMTSPISTTRAPQSLSTDLLEDGAGQRAGADDLSTRSNAQPVLTDVRQHTNTTLTPLTKPVRPFSATSRGAQPSPLSRVALNTSSDIVVAPLKEQDTEIITLDDDDEHCSTVDGFSLTGGVVKPIQRQHVPSVLFLHIVSCSRLEGCDSLIEPVVRVVNTTSGKVLFSTPAMGSKVHPMWTLDQASFFSVAHNKHELLEFVVCDNFDDNPLVLFKATLRVDEVKPTSAATLKVLPLLRHPSGDMTDSIVTVRIALTTADSRVGHEAVSPANEPSHLAQSSDSQTGIVIHVAKCCGIPSVDPNDSLTVEVQHAKKTLLRTPPSSASLTWRPDLATCRIVREPHESSFVAFIVRSSSKRGTVVARGMLNVDELAFSSTDVRDVKLALENQSLLNVKAALRLHVIDTSTVHHEAPFALFDFEALLVYVASFHSNLDVANAPWLPDPFVTVRKCVNTGRGKASSVSEPLFRSPLVFGETTAHWQFSDASCIVDIPDDIVQEKEPSTVIEVNVWDNDVHTSIGKAIVPVDIRMLAQQQRTRVPLDKGGDIGIVMLPLPVYRLGPGFRAWKWAVPPVLVVHVKSCRNISSGFADLPRDALVTVRTVGQRELLLKTPIHASTTCPEWPLESSVFALDLTSASLKNDSDELLFEVWDSNDALTELLGTATVPITQLVIGGGEHTFELCKPHNATCRTTSPSERSATPPSALKGSRGFVTIETLLASMRKEQPRQQQLPPQATPGAKRKERRSFDANLCVDPSELLGTTLTMLQEDVKIQTSSLSSSHKARTLSGSGLLLAKSSMSANEASNVHSAKVKVFICSCDHLPLEAHGSPFVIAQRGGTVLFSTPIVAHGDPHQPLWSRHEASVDIDVKASKGRFEEDLPIHFLVMRQDGQEVKEVGRSTLALHTVLNGGGKSITNDDSSQSGVIVVKTVDLRCPLSKRSDPTEAPTITVVFHYNAFPKV